MKDLRNKKIVVFDLDGTLTESKLALKADMAALLRELLKTKKVLVIGGGKSEIFFTQFVARLKCPKESFKNLCLMPTNSAQFYVYKNKWQLVYKKVLNKIQKEKIRKAIKVVLAQIKYTPPKKTYGLVIEDRKTEMAFSALGQKAPLALKEKWHKNSDFRLKIVTALKKYLPGFNIRLGGLTTVDITQKGIDKAYGIRYVLKYLSIEPKDVIFIGDALYKNGNDSPALKTGVDCVQVSGPDETKKIIKKILLN